MQHGPRVQTPHALQPWVGPCAGRGRAGRRSQRRWLSGAVFGAGVLTGAPASARGCVDPAPAPSRLGGGSAETAGLQAVAVRASARWASGGGRQVVCSGTFGAPGGGWGARCTGSMHAPGRSFGFRPLLIRADGGPAGSYECRRQMRNPRSRARAARGQRGLMSDGRAGARLSKPRGRPRMGGVSIAMVAAFSGRRKVGTDVQMRGAVVESAGNQGGRKKLRAGADASGHAAPKAGGRAGGKRCAVCDS